LFPHLIFAADFLQYGDTLCVRPYLPIGKVISLLVQICFFIDFGDILDHKGIVTWAILRDSLFYIQKPYGFWI